MINLIINLKEISDKINWIKDLIIPIFSVIIGGIIAYFSSIYFEKNKNKQQKITNIDYLYIVSFENVKNLINYFINLNEKRKFYKKESKLFYENFNKDEVSTNEIIYTYFSQNSYKPNFKENININNLIFTSDYSDLLRCIYTCINH